MTDQTDINDICGDILSNGKHLGNHQGRIKALMEHFAAAKTPLETIAGKRYMGRSQETIKRYCRTYSICLVDYVPLALRPPKPKKAPKS